VLERSLVGFRGELTVSDAATRGGLALRDAERGLHELVARYRGHLAATEKGELVFRFPRGLVARKETSAFRRGLARVGRAARGVGRFLVRAWVSVVMLGYAAAFAVILVAVLIGSSNNNSNNNNRGGDLAGVLLRGLAEALYWTFHPFSPVMVFNEPDWARHPVGRRHEPKVPFYEKVNRFVFGPATAPETDLATHRRTVMNEIRAQRGRIASGDVMRVTGLTRDASEALISQLLVDAEGEVEVSDEGAILYSFPELRRTVESAPAIRPTAAKPAWQERRVLPPLTGNRPETNLLFVGINAFNLVSSAVVIDQGLTVQRLTEWLTLIMAHHHPGEPPVMMPPPDGTPWVLGWIPLLFSTALFVLPVARALRRGSRRRAVERENGRLAVLATVLGAPVTLGAAPSRDIPQRVLAEAWQRGAGRAPTDNELRDSARTLGGELEIATEGPEADKLVYRFADLDAEQKALVRARAAATKEEAEVGDVVFSSDRD